MATVRGSFGKGHVQEKNVQTTKCTVNHEDVARVAYELYVQRGCVDGYDVEDWLRAEALVRGRTNGRTSGALGDRDHGR